MKLGIFNRLMGDGMQPLLVVSSDAGPFDCEFGRMHYGMELAVQAGMSPLQAIESATSVAARACGVAALTGTRGARQGGRPAGRPRQSPDDIRRMAKVAAVYKGGLKVACSPRTRFCLRSRAEAAPATGRSTRHPRGARDVAALRGHASSVPGVSP